jgi:hypothetical protein
MTATWHAPQTWVDNQLVSASDLNNQVRDNLEFLKTPTTGVATLASTLTTTSSTFTPATGLSITMTTSGGDVLLNLSGWGSNNTVAGGVSLDFGVDGTAQGHATFGLAGFNSATANNAQNASFTYLVRSLAAGSHIFTVRWGVTASTTGSLFVGAQFFAREI